MDGIGFIIIGVVTALNLIFVKKKFEQKRYEDATLDLILLIIITIIFGGSLGGLIIGTITSLMISLYLYASPPKFVGPIITSIKEEFAKRPVNRGTRRKYRSPLDKKYRTNI